MCFRHELSGDMQRELACCDKGLGTGLLIKLSIWLVNVFCQLLQPVYLGLWHRWGTTNITVQWRSATIELDAHPDPTAQFIVDVDASSTGFGALLTYRPGSKNSKADALSWLHDTSPEAPTDP